MSEKLDLSADETWLSFQINGVEFEVEAFDATDLLAENDKRYRNDPAFCQDCQEAFRIPDESWGVAKIPCPKCKKVCEAPTNFLDGVVELLRVRWGVKKCSRQTALRFYSSCIGAAEAVKKNIAILPGSPTGSESTPADSATQNAELS